MEKRVETYEDSRGIIVTQKGNPDELPKIVVFADLPTQAYELASKAVYESGNKVRTQYERVENGKFIDPQTLQAHVQIHILRPFDEPRVHKDIPGGPADLENYRQEVVEGIHDAWICPRDENGCESTLWKYTYHDRLFNWNLSTDLSAPDRGLLLPKGIDQIEKVVEELSRDITSRGAFAITWMPTVDTSEPKDRPCLQSFWFKAYENSDGTVGLNTNYLFRSRDRNAWFMNFWGLSDIVRLTCEKLSERINRKVVAKTIPDESYDLHIYGNDLQDFEKRSYPRIKNDENFKKNVYSPDVVADIIEEEKQKIANDRHYRLSEDGRRWLAIRTILNPERYSKEDINWREKHFSGLKESRLDNPLGINANDLIYVQGIGQCVVLDSPTKFAKIPVKRIYNPHVPSNMTDEKIYCFEWTDFSEKFIGRLNKEDYKDWKVAN